MLCYIWANNKAVQEALGVREVHAVYITYHSIQQS